MSVKIECQWGKKNKILVNPDGQVYPCCYIGNPGYMTQLDKRKSAYDHDVLKKYYDNAQNYNINKISLQQIVKSDWFQKDLPNAWKDYNNAPRMCKKWCTIVKENDDDAES